MPSVDYSPLPENVSVSNVILGGIVVLFLVLQYVVWLSDFGYLRLVQLERKIVVQEQDNDLLEKRNQRLRAEVIDLKQGTAALEERARIQLGMIKSEEIFFQVIEPDQTPEKP